MKSSIKKTSKLTTKDLVNCGIFIALFFVFTMVGGILFGPNPVLTFCLPASVALLTGPVYLLLLAKVPKRGPVTILGIIMGLFTFVTGMYWLWSVFYFVLGFVADRIAGWRSYRNHGLNTLSFILFSMNTLGGYVMLWINPESYFGYLVEKGTPDHYVEVMGAVVQGWILPAMVVSVVVCSLCSAMLGQLMLKRQFSKAGITA